MSEAPRAVIGMPVRNGEKFVRRSVESLLAQEFTDFALIISDNASTDGTWDILQEYASRDARIVPHRQQSNLGTTANFQYVLQQAQGDYFMWAGCDDWWGHGHLGNLVRELDDHPDAAVAMSATARHREDGEPLDIVRYSGDGDPNRMTKLRLAMRLAGGEFYHFYIYGLYRTAFLKEAFVNVPAVKTADRLFVCQVALAAKVRYVDEVSYMRQTFEGDAGERYRKNDESLAVIYSDSLGYWKTVVAMGPFLAASRVIPPREKRWIPLLVVRCALWLAALDVRSMLRQSLYTWLGRERARRLLKSRWR